MTGLNYEMRVRELARSLQADGLPMKDALLCFRREWLRAELFAARYNQCKVAAHAGMHRNMLSRQLAQLEIDLAVERLMSSGRRNG